MITINEYSRPGRRLDTVLGIVIHWPYAPNWGAKQVHDYFEKIRQEKRYASAHYAVGLEGEIVEIVPEIEMAYHCGSSQRDPKSGEIYTDISRNIFGKYASNRNFSPNMCTIGIEVCHIDIQGNMTLKTVQSLIKFVADICIRHKLDAKRQVLRHYDVVGWKDCPRYWVNNPVKWDEFLMAVDERVKTILG